MGFSVTWCAVPETHAETFLRELSLAPTGRVEEMPESSICCAKVTGGWRLVWYNEYGCSDLSEESLSRLSKNHDILVCLVEEHVMASSSELWVSGLQKWRISHEGEGGPRGLDVKGTPPKELQAIRQQLEAAQLSAGGDDADVDYMFDVPLKTAQVIVPFKHDEDWDGVLDGQFQELSKLQSKPTFLRRLFGA